jgi:hypothetical protein
MIATIFLSNYVSTEWFKWADSGSSVADTRWDELISEGIELHSKYMHRKARDLIVRTAKYHHSKQSQIISLLLERARAMLADGPARDEVCARGCDIFSDHVVAFKNGTAFVTFPCCGSLRILESAMAVAQMLLDAETIYIVSNELIAANSIPAALEGYHFVLKLLPNLPSAYHQIGLALSVCRNPCYLLNSGSTA